MEESLDGQVKDQMWVRRAELARYHRQDCDEQCSMQKFQRSRKVSAINKKHDHLSSCEWQQHVEPVTEPPRLRARLSDEEEGVLPKAARKSGCTASEREREGGKTGKTKQLGTGQMPAAMECTAQHDVHTGTPMLWKRRAYEEHMQAPREGVQHLLQKGVLGHLMAQI